MALTASNFIAVFWIAVIPAFIAFGLILFAVSEPTRPDGAENGRPTLSLADAGRLPAAFWIVVVIAERPDARPFQRSLPDPARATVSGR